MKYRLNLLLFFATMLSFSQQGINYKALIKDSDGNVLKSKTVDIRLNITKESGVAVYTEAHTVTTTENGLAVVFIGEGTPSDGNFADISWGDENFQLRVEIDIEQDGSFIDFGLSPFKYVPYAKIADIAKEAFNAELANRVTIVPKPYILGRTDNYTDGSAVFNGKYGWQAAQAMCEATYPNDPNVRAFTLEQISQALILGSYDTSNLSKINNFQFWAITPMTYGTTFPNPHQNNSFGLNGDGGSSNRGTIAEIKINAAAENVEQNTSNTYVKVFVDRASGTVLPCMCGTYKN